MKQWVDHLTGTTFHFNTSKHKKYEKLQNFLYLHYRLLILPNTSPDLQKYCFLVILLNSNMNNPTNVRPGNLSQFLCIKFVPSFLWTHKIQYEQVNFRWTFRTTIKLNLSWAHKIYSIHTAKLQLWSIEERYAHCTFAPQVHFFFCTFAPCTLISTNLPQCFHLFWLLSYVQCTTFLNNLLFFLLASSK